MTSPDATGIEANPEIFRTYDIRGIAERDLPDPVVRALGAAVASALGATALGARGTVAVGGDARVSTARIKKAFLEGVVATGADALDLGMTTTPMVYFATHHYAGELAGGVAITASHNPPEYNGFKLVKGKSALYGDDIQALKESLGAKTSGHRRGRIGVRDVREAYLADIAGRVALERPLRIVVDSGNGTAGLVGPECYRRLGCRVVELHSEPDGTFPNHPADPTVPEALEDLIRAVKADRADLGIGFDGDGDRIGVIDDRGRILWGDRLMALFFREVLAKYPGAPSIIEVKCSQALVEEVERLGGRPIFYRTGHSLIKAKMKEMGAPFTGEMSGHMFFADEFPGYDDAVYAGARLLRFLSRTRDSLSSLVDSVPAYHATPELRIGCPDAAKAGVVEAFVESARRDWPGVLTVDGARFQSSEGWGLVRASNTGPQLIARAEGKTPEARDRILSYIRKTLARHDAVDLSGVDRELARR